MSNPISHNEPGLWSHAISNRGPTLVLVSTVFLLISTAFVALRIFWRFKHRQRGWDDIFAVLAYITLLIQTIFGDVSARYGFGKHRSDIPITFPKAMLFFYLYQICYKILGTFTKLTFCVLYLRIFGTHLRFKRIVWLNIGIILAGGIAFTFGTIWQCYPLRRAWDKRIPGTCTDNMTFWFSHAAFNTFMDMVVFVLPVPLVSTLQMARKTKIGLISLFSLGAFTIAASIARMVFLRESAKSTSDPTWGSMQALIWTAIESNTAMICCCLPALRKLAANVWHKMSGKPMSSSENDTPTHSGAAARYHSNNRTYNDAIGQQDPSYKHNAQTLGNFTQIRASPRSSPILPPVQHRPSKTTSISSRQLDINDNQTEDDNRPSSWLNWILRPLSPLARSPTSQNIALQNPGVSHLAPKITLGAIYKPLHPVATPSLVDSVPVSDDQAAKWQHSSWMSAGRTPVSRPESLSLPIFSKESSNEEEGEGE